VINVAGIKASDLPAYLKTVFGRTFRNFQLTADARQAALDPDFRRRAGRSAPAPTR